MFRKFWTGLILAWMAAFLCFGCQEQRQTEETEHSAKSAVYHCPMHPQIIKDLPGLCPICGMDLVRIESESSEGQTEKYPSVQVSTDMIKTLKIRTKRVTLRDSSGILIPAKALVRTEGRLRVVVALGGGRFQPRPVEVGEEYRDSVFITQGLEDGEEVVVSGQFLLDSESGLRAAASATQAK